MRRDPGSRSALLQVAALAVLAVIASQVVTFVVILTTPPPEPSGFSAAAAADAVLGKPARTSDGRALTRRLSDRPGVREPSQDPLALLIASTVARRLDVPVDSVRVAVDRESLPGRRDSRWPRLEKGAGATPLILRQSADAAAQGADPTAATDAATLAAKAMQSAEAAAARADAAVAATGRTVTIRRPDGTVLDSSSRLSPLPPGSFNDIQVITGSMNRFSLLADSLTFRPFSISVRLADGRWSTVRPPQGLIEPWQSNLLISLAISLLLLAPIVWLLARRLTRPIRVFAAAAERLGDNPDAEPLKPTGPREVRTAIGVFNDMQAALRGHIRRRTQTVAAIAHDLRTPLTRLRFRAEQAPEALRDRMVADVEEMDALIGQALAYVRGEAPPERHDPFDLAELAADVVAGFAETGAAVTFVAHADLPAQGDPVALRRALSNLIDNAIRYGQVARVAALRDGPSAVITIADDGPGLSPEALDLLFEPFERGEGSRSRQTGGTGLGLTVARQAARAHGGEVTLANGAEGGLVAKLTAPLSQRERA